MRRRGRRPAALADLLARLASEPGAGRLRRAALEAGVRRALGPWLSSRLLGCRRDGDALVLELAGPEAEREVRALAGEVVLRLRQELGPAAPRRVEPVALAEPAPRRAAPGPQPAPGPAADRVPGAELSAALEAVEDPRLREQLGRVASRGSVGDG